MSTLRDRQDSCYIDTSMTLVISCARGFVMRTKFTLLLGSLLALLVAAPGAAQLKKVRFSVSAASIAEVPFRTANIKGFYRDEGLETDVILRNVATKDMLACLWHSQLTRCSENCGRIV